jgi:hypothetical protein
MRIGALASDEQMDEGVEKYEDCGVTRAGNKGDIPAFGGNK